MITQKKQPRVGIYAGTFDPVHAGHLSFALDAQARAGLDAVYLLPERLPRYKPGVEHYGHRVAMLKRAIKPHPTLALLELVDKQFTPGRTWPQLRRQFPDARITLLMGSDIFVNVPLWQDEHGQLKDCSFVVSIRSVHDMSGVLQTMQLMELPTSAITIMDSMQPELSSSQIRRAISLNQTVRGLLPSVQRYATKQWLYVQLPRT